MRRDTGQEVIPTGKRKSNLASKRFLVCVWVRARVCVCICQRQRTSGSGWSTKTKAEKFCKKKIIVKKIKNQKTSKIGCGCGCVCVLLRVRWKFICFCFHANNTPQNATYTHTYLYTCIDPSDFGRFIRFKRLKVCYRKTVALPAYTPRSRQKENIEKNVEN